MSKFFKGRGLEDLAHYTLLGISFVFSYTFSKDMLFGFMLMLLIFVILEPILMNEGISNKKTLQGKLYISLAIVIVLLNLLATCSVLINDYSKMLDEMLNNEYKSYSKLFQYFSDVTGIETMTITISIFFVFAILLELGVITSKILSTVSRQKKLGEYKKTFVEQFQDYQEKLAEENFNYMMNKLKIVTDDFVSESKNNLLDEEKFCLAENENYKNNIITENEKKENLLDVKSTSLAKEKTKTGNIKNHNNIINIEDKKVNLNKKSEELFKSKDLSQENINKYLQYAIDNTKDDNSIPGMKKIADEIGINQGEAQRIYKFLIKTGKLEKINNFKTKIIEGS